MHRVQGNTVKREILDFAHSEFTQASKRFFSTNTNHAAFLGQAMQDTRPIYTQILEDPFLKGVADGSLQYERFQYYLTQDIQYVQHYKTFWRTVECRLSNSIQRSVLSRINRTVLNKESEIQNDLLRNAKSQTLNNKARNYVNFQYVHSTTSPVSVGFAALVPCYILYRDFAGEIHPLMKRNNPYLPWVSYYASEGYANKVNLVTQLMQLLYEESTLEEQLEIFNAYKHGYEHERHFFNAAYNQPVD